MATKKEKRQRALEKREHMLESYRRSGLAALEKDRKHRFQKELQEWEENHTKNHSWKKRIKECPHCKLEIQAATRRPDALALTS